MCIWLYNKWKHLWRATKGFYCIMSSNFAIHHHDYFLEQSCRIVPSSYSKPKLVGLEASNIKTNIRFVKGEKWFWAFETIPKKVAKRNRNMVQNVTSRNKCSYFVNTTQPTGCKYPHSVIFIFQNKTSMFVV